jgi:hypothetical protein
MERLADALFVHAYPRWQGQTAHRLELRLERLPHAPARSILSMLSQRCAGSLNGTALPPSREAVAQPKPGR